MKLIIDINKEDFEIMKHNVAVDNPLCPINQKDMVIKIANGIPLNNLKTELTAITINGQVDEHTMFIRTGEQVKQMALDIIDKYKGDKE